MRAALIWTSPTLIPVAYGNGAAAQPQVSQTEKSWSLAELLPPKETWTPPSETTGTWSSTKDVFTRVTRAQNGSNPALRDFHDRQGLISLDDQELRLITLRGIQRVEFQEQSTLRLYMMNQLGRALGDHVRERSAVLQAISSGISFDTKAGLEQSRVTPGSPVRYGLVLKDVEPSGNGIHVAALTMDDRYINQILSDDSKARVNWTIGPLAEDSEKRLFESALDSGPLGPVDSLSGLLPDLRLRGKIAPNFEGGGGAQSLSGLRIKVEQPQGLYRMEMITGSGPAQMTQEVGLPVYGTLRLTRIMDGKFNVSRTSIVNALGFSKSLQLIPLNLHYTHTDASMKAESSFAAFQGRIGFEGHLTGLASPVHNQLYTLSYSQAL